MNKITDKLTVFFENPFWVGIFESVEENNLVVCKVVFGAEPKVSEIYELILNDFNNLQFSPKVEIKPKVEHSNPKRKQREIQNEANQLKVSTKSQLALQKQREEIKLERKMVNKEERNLEKQRKFEMKQNRHKRKHKGR
jgi:hypothetical protein